MSIVASVAQKDPIVYEARLAALRSEIDREEALVETLKGNPADGSMEQFQLLREQRETEKAVLALNDALGKSDKDVVDFLWSVEQDAPYSVVALHRETGRLLARVVRVLSLNPPLDLLALRIDRAAPLHDADVDVVADADAPHAAADTAVRGPDGSGQGSR